MFKLVHVKKEIISLFIVLQVLAHLSSPYARDSKTGYTCKNNTNI